MATLFGSRLPAPAASLLGVATLGIALAFTVSDTQAAVRGPLSADDGPRLAVTELQGTQTQFWAVAASNPRRRALLGQATHADGWGVKAQGSPDGRLIAFMLFPNTGIDPAADSELWTLDVSTGAQRRLGAGLDLMATPRWSPDSTLVAARRTAVGGVLRSFDLLGYPAEQTDAAPAILATERNVAWAGAVGWTGGGFTFATIDANGTWLHAAGPPVRLSNGIARDFALSPDGARLLFAEVPGPGQPGYRLASADIASGVLTPIGGPPGAFSPIWRPDGALTAASAAGDAALFGAAVSFDPAQSTGSGTTVAQPLPGHTLTPLEWSPNAAVLAARLTSASPGRPSSDRLAMVDNGGVPRPLGFAGYAGFAGWLP